MVKCFLILGEMKFDKKSSVPGILLLIQMIIIVVDLIYPEEKKIIF